MAKILIAEDDANNVEILTDLLSDEGYDLAVANNRAEAVSKAQSEAPDLILMDLQMPESAENDALDNEAGLAATREIRAQPATGKIPIIALTAHNMFHQRERIYSAGCNELQAKPYDFISLLDTIERHLDGGE